MKRRTAFIIGVCYALLWLVVVGILAYSWYFLGASQYAFDFWGELR